jgi:hypothetical protein
MASRPQDMASMPVTIRLARAAYSGHRDSSLAIEPVDHTQTKWTGDAWLPGKLRRRVGGQAGRPAALISFGRRREHTAFRSCPAGRPYRAVDGPALRRLRAFALTFYITQHGVLDVSRCYGGVGLNVHGERGAIDAGVNNAAEAARSRPLRCAPYAARCALLNVGAQNVQLRCICPGSRGLWSACPNARARPIPCPAPGKRSAGGFSPLARCTRSSEAALLGSDGGKTATAGRANSADGFTRRPP